MLSWSKVEGKDRMSGKLTRTEQALLLGLGSSFFVYGAAQWTGFVTYTPPAIVYIIVGVVALFWVVSVIRRS